jgi:hypothetical protein
VLDQTFTTNVSLSNVVIRDRPAEHARIDGLDLLNGLVATPPWWKKKIVTHNWFMAERLARDFFETSGLGSSNEAIIAQCNEQYGLSASGKLILDRTSYAELVRQLRRQYDNSDE